MKQPPTAGPLAKVDARVVPALGRGLRGVARGVRRLGGVTGPPGRWVARTARRSPTITTAIVSVVVAAALLVFTDGDHHHAVAPAPPEPAVVLPGNALGPIAGQPVSTYLATARGRLSDLQTSRESQATAVVDFTSYLTGPAVESVLSGLDGVNVALAYVQVPPPADAGVHAIALAPGTDVSDALTKLAADAQQTVVNYHAHVLLAHSHPTAENLETVSQYAEVARQAKIDARGISADLGCVFALEVTGPPAELQTLAAKPDVRVLDPAPSTVATADLMVVPLEPQVTAEVPTLTFGAQY